MANPLNSHSAVLLLLLLLTSVSGAFNIYELNAGLQSLSNHGYSLFTNAVTTSGLLYELLSSDTAVTMFAPTDDMLHALNIATEAAVYFNTLRYHIVPNHRYTFAHLQNLSSPFLDTLLPHHAILVAEIRDGDVFPEIATVSVMVDGVRISDPDIYIGSRIAVHGIDGMLLSGLNVSQESGLRKEIAQSPVPVGDIPVDEMFKFDSTIANPIPEIDQIYSTPVDAETDIPVVGTQIDEIPVKTKPKMKENQTEKFKGLSRKRRVKHHRHRHRRRHHHHHHHHHRRHGGAADQRLNEF